MSDRPRRPHIVIFNPDQWRADVMGHLGNPAAVTPVLDRLVADEAVSFRYAFCQNPVCTPSRCSFMTGWYPHTAGHRMMYHMLRPHEPVLLKQLKDNGYFVWWGGKNDLVPGQGSLDPYCDVKYTPSKPVRKLADRVEGDWRGQPGSDSYYSFFGGKMKPASPGEYIDGDWAYVEGACEFIRNRPTDQPVCIYLPLLYPHPPYMVEEPWFSLIDRSKVPPPAGRPERWSASLLAGISLIQNLGGWDERRWRELQAVYYGMCARSDHMLGLVLDALREAGIYDDTAVFVFSDHGDFTGDYGLVEKTQNTFQDCLTRVPLVLKPPAGVEVQPGVRDESLVELVDFPATVYELTGIEPNYTHFGKSLLDQLAGRAEQHRDAVFCEGGRRHGETHCMESESTSSCNPQGLYWPRISLQHSEGPEHSKAVMCRTAEFKYVRRLYETDELYDLRSDPHELHNRINDPALADVLAELKDRMLTFFMDTGDVVPHQPDER